MRWILLGLGALVVVAGVVVALRVIPSETKPSVPSEATRVELPPPPSQDTDSDEPAPPPMTEAEIAEVFESAQKANAAIEAANRAYKKLHKAAGGHPSWEAIIRFDNDLGRQLDQLLDEEGAHRLLKEHRDHPNEPGVRKVLHRVQLARVHRDLNATLGGWDDVTDRLEARRKDLPDFWTRLKALDEQALKGALETRHQLNLVRMSLQPDEKANLKRARERADTLNRVIDAWEQDLRDMAPRFKEEEFVVQGGIEVTAQQLWKDFDANEIAALQKYRGKRVKLSGKVQSITADFRDEPQVHLRTKNRYQTVTISGGPASEAAKLKKGDNISVICGNITEVVGSPVCTLE